MFEQEIDSIVAFLEYKKDLYLEDSLPIKDGETGWCEYDFKDVERAEQKAIEDLEDNFDKYNESDCWIDIDEVSEEEFEDLKELVIRRAILRFKKNN